LRSHLPQTERGVGKTGRDYGETMSDAELNKAAVLIVKLLLRTREGRIQWSSCAPALSGGRTYRAGLEDQMSAYLSRSDEEFDFVLMDTTLLSTEERDGFDRKNFISERTIIRIGLAHSWRSVDDVTPESIVYANLEQLFQLAENPESASDDRLYKQALTYLDKIAV
jgi:hypothetical protein